VKCHHSHTEHPLSGSMKHVKITVLLRWSVCAGPPKQRRPADWGPPLIPHRDKEVALPKQCCNGTNTAHVEAPLCAGDEMISGIQMSQHLSAAHRYRQSHEMLFISRFSFLLYLDINHTPCQVTALGTHCLNTCACIKAAPYWRLVCLGDY
jgi:hypothetical protein